MAIAYDFDGTLAPGNMQEHSFIPELKLSTKEFWDKAKQMARDHDMDEILAYMFQMLEGANTAKVKITRQNFRKHGKDIEFFEGVREWFPRLNKYARGQGVKLDHFIISSGLREMIEGTPIHSHFKYLFASGFAYDQNDVAFWPALAVNYTNKTQYLFRINKGILNSYDNQQINKFVPDEDREIPFSNMAYIGDGETDVPCMKMLKYQGGCSVAVFNPKRRGSKNRKSAKDTAFQLLAEKRAEYALPTDYRDGRPLDLLMKALIDKVAASGRMQLAKHTRRSDHSVAIEENSSSQGELLSPGSGIEHQNPSSIASGLLL